MEVDCADTRMFRSTDARNLYDDVDSVVEVRRKVAAGTAADAMLTDVMYVTAMAPSGHGLLSHPRVRSDIDVLRVFHVDWAHTCLQDGTMTNELSCFVEACRQKTQLGARFWESQLRSGWSFPFHTKVKQRALHRMFNEYKIPSDDQVHTVKGSITDILGVYSLVRHIVETTPELNRPELDLERASFFKGCSVVDSMLAAKRLQVSLREAAAYVREANVQHLQAHVAAYGKRKVKPKNHWAFDVADAMERDDEWMFLPDALSLERIHVTVKQVAIKVKNTNEFERSTLSTLCLVHKQRLLGDVLEDGLRGPTATIAEDVILGRRIEIGSVRISEGDVVFRCRGSIALGVVIACAKALDEHHLVVEELEAPQVLTPHSYKAGLNSTRTAIWEAFDVQVALAWYEGEPGSLTALV